MVLVVLHIFKWLRFLPLPALRAVGALLGYLLYALMRSRRHTVRVNLQLCFRQWTAREREARVRKVFVHFMQSWLDRFWLWHSPQAMLNKRLKINWLQGQSLQGLAGTVLFAPHFVGLDAGRTGLNALTGMHHVTIYAKQKNPTLDAWVKTGRERSSTPQKLQLVEHLSSVRPAVQCIRQGGALYLLPDMNYEPDDSFFLPFFGNICATLPILPRYANLGGKDGVPAKVVPVITHMTTSGYEIDIHPALDHYPSGRSDADLKADSLRMNQMLEQWVMAAPTQYYWVHRRFKDQPRDANGCGGPNPYSDPVGYQAQAHKTANMLS